MKYSKPETLNEFQSSPFFGCITNLNVLVSKEGFKGEPVFETDAIVLNLDCAEELLANSFSRLRESSMDCCFVITDESKSLNEVLLVEFRYNYTNLKNVNRKKIVNKVEGSKRLLSDSFRIHDINIFVFQSNLKEQAKYRFNRILPRFPMNYKIMDTEELMTTFW